jgi:hypothetical protein
LSKHPSAVPARHGNFSLPSAGVALGKEPFADKNFAVRSLPSAALGKALQSWRIQ